MTSPVDKAPNTPADAFAQFVEVVRKSRTGEINAASDDLYLLLRPFLINPARHEEHVRVIVKGIALAHFCETFGTSELFQLARLFRRGTTEQSDPDFIKKLRALEGALTSDLRPGSVSLHQKPIRYLDTPTGYGDAILHRYRVQVQLGVDVSISEALDAVSLEMTVEAAGAEIIVDDITPAPGFSVVGLRRSTGIQSTLAETTTAKASAGAEVGAGGSKVTSSVEATSAEQRSTLHSLSAEHTLSRVEQYLIARKAGNRAFWRALAGIGEIDVGGIEYSADLLVPDSVREVALKVEAKVEWRRAGTFQRTCGALYRYLARPH
jgi:hypothetical protein